MKRSRYLVSAALVCALLWLSGCQTIRSHNPFRHREPDYKSAQQEQPLEVPPGLDQPPTSDALAVPDAGSGTPAITVNGQQVNAGTGAPPSAGTEASTEAPATAPPGAVVSGNSLSLADDPDSAYRRVGLALQRGGVGTVSAHDDNAHTYQIAVDSVVTQKSEGNFIHRIFHHDHTETVTGTVNVGIAASGTGSVVNVQGDPDAVERVLSVLQQRLGGS
ncbi:MAG: hypothetical protein JSS21_07550 [Proteobacteria bacterium]|nr:hypothetical protein [Pseudomonadota bacterium]